jgi:Rps23 Pro-64 3,4-dihydroxylase Tpa1-like proline 4-hydroxylase
MEQIFEQDNFISIDECKTLINYQETHSPNDMSNGFWNSRIVTYYDESIKDLTNNIHQRIINSCIKFYEEENIYLEFTNLVYWGVGMQLGAHVDKKPNYTPNRDYSSVLYLNDDFIGGETYFRDYNYNIAPKPGKLVIFTSGEKHIHGVTEILSGKRYTMTTWYTKNINCQIA